MKKTVILLMILFLFFQSYAQKKYKTMPVDKWESAGWVNYFIVVNGGVQSKSSGLYYSLDLIGLRIKFLQFNLLRGSVTTKLFGEPLYLLPFGLYIPLGSGHKYTIGASSMVYMEGVNLADLPNMAELSLKLDYNFLFSISAGYKYTFTEKNFNSIFTEIGKFNNLNQYYAQVSIGTSQLFNFSGNGFLGLQGGNNKYIEDEIIEMPTPKLSILAAENYEILTGDNQKIKFTLVNYGQGNADDLEIKARIIGPGVNITSDPTPTYIPILSPGSSKDFEFNITADPKILKQQDVKIHIKCREKDGFNSEQNLYVKIIPLSISDSEVPKLSLNANIVNENGSDTLFAGTVGTLNIKVTNQGTVKAIDVKIIANNLIADSNGYPTIDIKETIAQLLPKEEKIIKVPIAAGIELPDGKFGVEIKSFDINGFEAAPTVIYIVSNKIGPPVLDIEGVKYFDENNNGIIEKGKLVNVSFLVVNTGQSTAKNVKARIIIDGSDIFYGGIDYYSFNSIGPGETREIEFPFSVNYAYEGNAQLPIYVEISEQDGKFKIKKDLEFKLDK